MPVIGPQISGHVGSLRSPAGVLPSRSEWWVRCRPAWLSHRDGAGDHLGGSMLGSDLAEQIRERSEGTTLGDVMATFAPRFRRIARR